MFWTQYQKEERHGGEHLEEDTPLVDNSKTQNNLDETALNDFCQVEWFYNC